MTDDEYLKMKNEAGRIIRDYDAGVTEPIGVSECLKKLEDAYYRNITYDSRMIGQCGALRELILIKQKLWVAKTDGLKADFVPKPIDTLLEEREEVYGDSDNSGKFFEQGVWFLQGVNEASEIPRPEAFDGHMYMVMLKLIRLMHNPYHQDSYDDLLGYLKLAKKALEPKL